MMSLNTIRVNAPDEDEPPVKHKNAEKTTADGVDCDFTIVNEGHRYSVHKKVLSKHSNYFLALLEGETCMKEVQDNEVCLQGIHEAVMQSVVNYMYDKAIDISWSTLDSLLNAASYLQIDLLISQCSQWINENFQVEHYRSIVETAKLYSLSSVIEYVHNHVAEHFQLFLNDKDLLMELELDELTNIIAKDSLVVSSERLLLSRLEDWLHVVNEVPVERSEPLTQSQENDVISLLSNIRFCLMSSTDLVALASASYPKEIGSLIKSGVQYHEDFMQGKTVQSSVQDRVRGAQPAIILVLENGKDQQHEILACRQHCGETQLFSLYANTARHKTCGVVVVDNRLYTLSVENYGGFDHNSAITFSCYNPCLRKQQCLSRPSSQIIPAAMAVLGRRIYICGGVSRSNTVFVAFCEVFDVDTGQWGPVVPLPVPVNSCAAVGLNGQVYLSGGQLQQPARTLTNQLLSLKPGDSEWQTLANMNVARRGHCLVAAGDDCFIACGGLTDAAYRRSRNTTTIPLERYDIKTNQWTEISHCPTIPGPSLGHFIILPHQPKTLYSLGHELPGSQEHEIWGIELSEDKAEEQSSSLHMALPERYKLNHAFAVSLHINFNDDFVKKNRCP